MRGEVAEDGIRVGKDTGGGDNAEVQGTSRSGRHHRVRKARILEL